MLDAVFPNQCKVDKRYVLGSYIYIHLLATAWKESGRQSSCNYLVYCFILLLIMASTSGVLVVTALVIVVMFLQFETCKYITLHVRTFPVEKLSSLFGARVNS